MFNQWLEQSCKIDCENCDYCEIANCDCDQIAISQTTQSDFWEGCAISQTKQSDFLNSRNCENCESCEIEDFICKC